MANLLIWWRQRTPSEQRLLLGLTGLLAACAFWYGLWQPWRAREAQWRQTLGERAGQPALDDGAGSAPAAAQPAARAGGKEALTALVMREAASHGLTVIRLQPQENVCRSPFSPALSGALIDWLDAPAMRGVNAISLSVTG
ncbi:type II secretion system protein M [Klebsiella pneumoniae]|nr:type II secretion system protein M [Klebsiella pneumoniae]